MFIVAKPKSTVVSNITEAKRRPDGPRGVFGRSIAFFRETVWELKRVRWPGRQEVVNYTVASLVTCIIIGGLVVAFDFGVAKVMSLIGLV